MTYAQRVERALGEGAPRDLVERAVAEFGRYGFGAVIQAVRFVMAEIARTK